MKILDYDVVVVGTGAAGYACACRVAEYGKQSAAIVTENVQYGTSRNAGSDKQTYYKLSLAGEAPDSVERMARELFAGGSVDGDNALCEAALSVRCFYDLAAAGVAFPTDPYGRSVGYKTDHDPCARGTSAGPLTSRDMTEALERRAERLRVPVYGGLLAVQVLLRDGRVCGLLCTDDRGEFTAFRAASVVLATGGPAGIYSDTVYPSCQTGATGLALEAGARLQNMTEWQYGLASVAPRWNVSGTYMQVLPRFVSVDTDGTEREFLAECFDDPYEALSLVFLKGYQWPFDSARAADGSSVIDLLVYRETVLRGREVYLDYTRNPFGLAELEFDRLSAEARDYLRAGGACFGTPAERLEAMNAPALRLYRDKGVDLTREKLRIALCAQHNNGGIAVDSHWQTSVPGLYAVGECAGTHGVRRPGGSALNAGQVGALRAAEHIAFAGCRTERAGVAAASGGSVNALHSSASALGIAPPDAPCSNQNDSAPAPADVSSARREFDALAAAAQKRHRALLEAAARCPSDCPLEELRRQMSRSAAAIRCKEQLRALRDDLCVRRRALEGGVGTRDPLRYYKYRDAVLVQSAVAEAMWDYAGRGCVSRGSSLLLPSEEMLRELRPRNILFAAEGDRKETEVQEVRLDGTEVRVSWRPVRGIPPEGSSFETVWKEYRQTHGI